MDFQTELQYIQSVQPGNPGGTFNDDPDCFVRYVEMQAKQAVKHGKDGIAQEMLAHIGDSLI